MYEWLLISLFRVKLCQYPLVDLLLIKKKSHWVCLPFSPTTHREFISLALSTLNCLCQELFHFHKKQSDTVSLYSCCLYCSWYWQATALQGFNQEFFSTLSSACKDCAPLLSSCPSLVFGNFMFERNCTKSAEKLWRTCFLQKDSVFQIFPKIT